MDSSIGYKQPGSVEITPHGTEIRWTTYFEQDIAKYYVQRSLDGVIFQSVGYIEPFNGGEMGINYLFIDIAR